MLARQFGQTEEISEPTQKMIQNFFDRVSIRTRAVRLIDRDGLGKRARRQVGQIGQEVCVLPLGSRELSGYFDQKSIAMNEIDALRNHKIVTTAAWIKARKALEPHS